RTFLATPSLDGARELERDRLDPARVPGAQAGREARAHAQRVLPSGLAPAGARRRPQGAQAARVDGTRSVAGMDVDDEQAVDIAADRQRAEPDGEALAGLVRDLEGSVERAAGAQAGRAHETARTPDAH